MVKKPKPKKKVRLREETGAGFEKAIEPHVSAAGGLRKVLKRMGYLAQDVASGVQPAQLIALILTSVFMITTDTKEGLIIHSIAQLSVWLISGAPAIWIETNIIGGLMLKAGTHMLADKDLLAYILHPEVVRLLGIEKMGKHELRVMCSMISVLVQLTSACLDVKVGDYTFAFTESFKRTCRESRKKLEASQLFEKLLAALVGKGSRLNKMISEWKRPKKGQTERDVSVVKLRAAPGALWKNGRPMYKLVQSFVDAAESIVPMGNWGAGGLSFEAGQACVLDRIMEHVNPFVTMLTTWEGMPYAQSLLIRPLQLLALHNMTPSRELFKRYTVNLQPAPCDPGTAAEPNPRYQPDAGKKAIKTLNLKHPAEGFPLAERLGYEREASRSKSPAAKQANYAHAASVATSAFPKGRGAAGKRTSGARRSGGSTWGTGTSRGLNFEAAEEEEEGEEEEEEGEAEEEEGEELSEGEMQAKLDQDKTLGIDDGGVESNAPGRALADDEKLDVGKEVWAKYKGQMWYRGTVTEAHPNGTSFNIRYHDGERQRKKPRELVRRL